MTSKNRLAMVATSAVATTLPKRLAVALAVIALSGATAEAQLVGDQEFDFEEGVLEPFEGSGDVGVLDENVIEGNFSAFINTDDVGDDTLSGDPAVGFVCSFLDGPEIFPETQRATLSRYATRPPKVSAPSKNLRTRSTRSSSPNGEPLMC
jgi:hypothetical protein